MMLHVRIRDITGGFKCFRREVLEAVLSSDLRTSGYGFQIEVTYRTLRAGFVVNEIPIVFHERRAGVSKMSARIAVEAAWQVLALKLVQWRPTSPSSIDSPVTVDNLPDALDTTGTGSR
jgi:dolichol-phosphate mannosyltransferase